MLAQRNRVIDLDGGSDSALPVVVPVRPQLVKLLADEVRRIYVLCYREVQRSPDYGSAPMPQWDGGEDAYGTRHQPIWPKIVQFILEHGLEPISFVRAQFWGPRRGTRPPAPNTLLNLEATARYRAYQQQALHDALQEYEGGLRLVQCEVLLLTKELGWEYRRALRYALLNVVAVRASALFRHCVAVREGLRDVSANFRDQALLQYVFQQETYDAAWGDKIPIELRQEGEALRRNFLGGRG